MHWALNLVLLTAGGSAVYLAALKEHNWVVLSESWLVVLMAVHLVVCLVLLMADLSVAI